ncbi:MoaD/ThiS family protein [Helicobacter marmotae]|uniref:MoaD/ThiS family protein n=1 Tax=Helicobacter marmotae TaxID=152490 RepID=A0A3D8I7L2_9HELI|nr:MoaD/ThiS family protein [Helicobacter marmotae]RDU60734.1 MoaD/ThiS family protein [Helicobacter marmotae]
MIQVEFLGPMSDIPPRQLEVKNLSELKAILSQDKALSSWLEVSALAVNDEIIEDISHPLKNGDKVLLLPPVCGG